MELGTLPEFLVLVVLGFFFSSVTWHYLKSRFIFKKDNGLVISGVRKSRQLVIFLSRLVAQNGGYILDITW